ncbi:TetR/AcrR family transcriptional regulator [Agromyces seonyuensis]|uniref:TetR family transcriptional regulator n=1 Tax=Agromyces seonyuensis TaxID=2662446 RepID=A0A6I4P6M0_9MICO|nr:TetR/AcrR family transcriptional regulator [Agromyces seonyuensis]MWB99297.1 TetR family transcriptional regulator [Agromyces seonyuensis]
MSDGTESEPEPELPRAVALAWGIAANPQRGPKRELSIERIVDAAIEIADAEGLGAVSMSRVAAALGFTPMSLYRYVTSKDDLLLLMQEAASEVPIPEAADDADWRSGLARWARSARAGYHEHPWLSDLPIQGVPITPNNLAMVDWFLREVREVPLDPGEKMGALLLLANYSRAYARQERDLAAADPGDVDGANFLAGLVPFITPERFPDFAPFFLAGGYVGDGTEDADVDFEFGLARILDGLARPIEERGGGATAAHDEPEPLDPDSEPLPRDPAVREANRGRRDAERTVREAQKALKEARKRERDEIKLARQRAAEAERKAAERTSREAERAARDAERAARRR